MSNPIDEDDPNWLAGYKSAERSHYLRMLAEAMRGLGYENAELAQLVTEREWAIIALREVCGDHGDNDWPDTLNLSDIIQKHLANHLYEPRELVRDLIGAANVAIAATPLAQTRDYLRGKIEEAEALLAQPQGRTVERWLPLGPTGTPAQGYETEEAAQAVSRSFGGAGAALFTHTR